MEEINDIKVLKEQIENNITSWYPYEKDVQYITIKDFNKDKKEELINAVKELSENGRILIIADNVLGMKTICQETENENRLFNRKQIEKILDENGLTYRKFYYPLPNSEMTNVIFTDKHLPDLDTISRDINFYEENAIKKNEEIYEYKKLIKQNPELFKIFANTFFIEAGKKEFADNGIEFVSFSNMRKEEYRIITTIVGDKVYKVPANEKAKTHIENVKQNISILNKLGIDILDEFDDEKIISKYQKDELTVDKVIINNIKQGNMDSVRDLIQEIFNNYKEKLEVCNPENNVFDKYEIEYKKENIENLTFVKYGFWDLIFQNIFYIDNKCYTYDQEWLEENLPLEYIVYRTFLYNSELQKFIDMNEIYEKFGITEKNIELFNQLDSKIQEKIRSELSWNFHAGASISLDEIMMFEKNRKQMTEEYLKLLNEKDARIKFLEDNMEQTCKLLKEKEDEVNYMKNSKSWKITKPLRKLKGSKE